MFLFASRPGMDIYAPFTAIFPLVFILLVSMLKDGYEDYKRHKTDKITNSKLVRIYKKNGFVQKKTEDVRVGDFIFVKSFDVVFDLKIDLEMKKFLRIFYY